MNGEPLTVLIYDSCRLLDRERFDAWLALCTPTFHYRIVTFSDELDRSMIWMDQDKDGLGRIFENVNNHERYTGKLRRHVGMVQVTAVRGDTFEVESAVAVYHTELNGVTGLYATGSYRDRIQRSKVGLLITEREVVLDTRRLAFGPHVPL